MGEKGEGRLPVVKEQSDIEYLQNIYKRLNPIYPFGIMSILEWTFAYTGFVQCVENDGDIWNVIPREGEFFETLKSRLTLETEGGNIIMKPQPQDDGKKKKLFGIF